MAEAARWIALVVGAPFVIAFVLIAAPQVVWLPLAIAAAFLWVRTREVGRLRDGLNRLEAYANTARKRGK
jgi:hypothetical protein